MTKDKLAKLLLIKDCKICVYWDIISNMKNCREICRMISQYTPGAHIAEERTCENWKLKEKLNGRKKV